MSSLNPSALCHLIRFSFQCSYHCFSSPGLIKNCISICSNSRMRKMNCRATISFLKAFPTWAMPNGSFIRPDFWTFIKFTKIPCAVSGLRYILLASSLTEPTFVSNIRLNCLTSVQLREPDTGSAISQSTIICRISARSLFSEASTNRFLTPAILSASSVTLLLVCLNIASSNVSPKRFAALSTSFLIFSSSFSKNSSISTSARYLFLESLLSISGSLKASTWPEAFQTSGCIKIAESSPTILSCINNMASHQYLLMLFFNSTPF